MSRMKKQLYLLAGVALSLVVAARASQPVRDYIIRASQILQSTISSSTITGSTITSTPISGSTGAFTAVTVSGNATAAAFIGNATSATMLQTAGALCAVGRFPAGVDASGNTVNCQTDIAGNAATASVAAALSSTTTCPAGQYADGISTAGAAHCQPLPTPPARVCNGDGSQCYKIATDGTINAWGTISVSFSGATLASAHLTYAPSFTQRPSLVLTNGLLPSSTTDAVTVFHRNGSSSGADIYIRCPTNIGGSGCNNMTGTGTVDWHATGY